MIGPKGSGKWPEVLTYEPDNSIRKGYANLFREIGEDILRNRWLTYQLFKRDLLSIYKQSLIGILWSVIIPLVSVGTFLMLNSAGIFSIGRLHVPYPLYAVLGIVFWQLFATGLVAGSNSLVKAGPMIVKINFSKKSLVIASQGQALIAFSIQFVVLGAMFLYYGIVPDRIILFTPLLVVPVLLFTLGLAFLLSLLNGVFRDIGNIISILVTFLMFLTPVLYAKPETGLLSSMSRYNPLYYLVSVPRDLILTGKTGEPGGFALSILVALISFLICILFFHLTETRVAERI